MTTVDTPLVFGNGVTAKNRIVKAAMTESLADDWGRPTQELVNLYKEFAKGGAGLLITGNIQVDRRFLERPGNVTIEGKQSEESMRLLAAYAKAGEEFNVPIIAQLSHPGRQSDRRISKSILGPSNVELDIPPIFYYRGNTLTALTLEQIKDVQDRFVNAAVVCKEAGFAGIELHAAHGYLLSSFMNPKANVRTDKYGGSLENRARMLLETFEACKAATGSDFLVTVKLNSSDFQQGGFTVEESIQVARWLHDLGCDFLEISGGSYESTVMFNGSDKKGKSGNSKPHLTNSVREAYFVHLADDLKAAFPDRPLMITGGFRSLSAMNETLQSGSCDLIGVGRPMTLMPDSPGKLIAGEIDSLPRYEDELAIAMVNYLPNTGTVRSLRTLVLQAFMYMSQYSIANGNGPLKAKDFYWGCVSDNTAHEVKKALNMKDVTWLGGIANNTAYQQWGSILSRFMHGSTINSSVSSKL